MKPRPLSFYYFVWGERRDSLLTFCSPAFLVRFIRLRISSKFGFFYFLKERVSPSPLHFDPDDGENWFFPPLSVSRRFFYFV